MKYKRQDEIKHFVGKCSVGLFLFDSGTAKPISLKEKKIEQDSQKQFPYC